MTNKDHHDIGDDEIRIISSNDSSWSPGCGSGRPSRRPVYILLVIAAAVAVALAIWASVGRDEAGDVLKVDSFVHETQPAVIDTISKTVVTETQRYCEMTDTVVDGHRLVIIIPRGAVPTLQRGGDMLGDTTVILAAEAAGVRNDNGEIVGACVIDGQLLSKGRSKAGFCAIINGVMTIGVADTTPLLEQALESDGYFFRQYPLVVGGQVVENKPRGRSLRKALAEYKGQPAIILSAEAMTFGDFSTALADAGVTNAIYLIGSSSCCIVRNAAGERITFGQPRHMQPVNTTYIIWR